MPEPYNSEDSERKETLLSPNSPEVQPVLPADMVETPPGSATLQEPLAPTQDAITVSLAAVEAKTETGQNQGKSVVGIQHYQFPNHVLHESIGQGGMGIVYRAVHLLAKREVAIKTLNSAVKDEDRLCKRFKLEAEAVARLKHENIVQIYEVGEIEIKNGSRVPYFTMELIRHGTLSQRLRKATKLSFAEIGSITRQLALALDCAHTAGVTHRDIKPSNILLDENNKPKLTDFGLAIVTDVTMDTLTNAVLGTPAYMSPEQASGSNKEVGPSSDIYSLGATLYEMLVGRAPFEGQNNLEIAQKVILGEVASPRKLRQDVPAGLEAICMKCLEKSPKHRYATAKEVAEDIGRWERGEETIARPLTNARRSIRWVNRNKVALGLVALFGGLLYAAIMGSKPKEDTKEKKTRTDWEWVSMLDKGPVTIIPEKGLPEYTLEGNRWLFGEAFLLNSSTGSESACIEKYGSAAYKLFPEHGKQKYRLTMEMQQTKADQIVGEVGVILGYNDFTTLSGHKFGRFLEVSFSDFFTNAERAERAGVINFPKGQTPAPHRLKVADVTVDFMKDDFPKLYQTFFDIIPFTAAEERIAKLPNDGTVSRLPPWRKLILDVSPEEVVVQFETEKGIMEKKSIPAKAIDEFRSVKTRDLSKKFNEEVSLPAWSPTKAIGIYVRNSSLNIRNVVMEAK